MLQVHIPLAIRYKIIQRGDADVMICGGAEATIQSDGLGWIRALCAPCLLAMMSRRKASRPFDIDRDGFVMGEGAGVLILESLEHAQKRGAQIYAEVIGYGMSADAYHMTDPAPGGEGCALYGQSDQRCRILPRSGLIISMRMEHLRQSGDISETTAIKKAFGDHAYKVAVSSTKSMTGHLLGAAGGVEAVICGLTLQNGIIAPTINLDNPKIPECDLDYVPNEPRKADVHIAMSNSFGFGGHNATIAKD